MRSNFPSTSAYRAILIAFPLLQLLMMMLLPVQMKRKYRRIEVNGEKRREWKSQRRKKIVDAKISYIHFSNDNDNFQPIPFVRRKNLWCKKWKKKKIIEESLVLFFLLSPFKWNKWHDVRWKIIVVHYGVITNMAAIALIHLSIYECIILVRSSRSRAYTHSISFFRLLFVRFPLDSK